MSGSGKPAGAGVASPPGVAVRATVHAKPGSASGSGAAARPTVLSGAFVTVAKLLGEILSSEHVYRSQLEHLQTDFQAPLQSAPPLQAQFEIGLPQLQGIFSNLEAILGFHRIFAEELAAALTPLANWVKKLEEEERRVAPRSILDSRPNVPPALLPLPNLTDFILHTARLILKYADFLKIYTMYIGNYEQSLLLLTEKMGNSSKFCKWCEEQKKKSKQWQNLDLNQLLILPIQRPPRYELFIRELIKQSKPLLENNNAAAPAASTSPSASSVAAPATPSALLAQAYDKLLEINQHVNESKRFLDHYADLVALNAKLKDSLPQDEPRVFLGGSLFKSGRKLLKEGSLGFRKKEGQEKKIRTYFLFNDLLLWLDSNEKYKQHVELANAHVADAAADTPSPSSLSPPASQSPPSISLPPPISPSPPTSSPSASSSPAASSEAASSFYLHFSSPVAESEPSSASASSASSKPAASPPPAADSLLLVCASPAEKAVWVKCLEQAIAECQGDADGISATPGRHRVSLSVVPARIRKVSDVQVMPILRPFPQPVSPGAPAQARPASAHPVIATSSPASSPSNRAQKLNGAGPVVPAVNNLPSPARVARPATAISKPSPVKAASPVAAAPQVPAAFANSAPVSKPAAVQIGASSSSSSSSSASSSASAIQAWQQSTLALSALNRGEMTAMKHLKMPPLLVRNTLSLVALLMADWVEAEDKKTNPKGKSLSNYIASSMKAESTHEEWGSIQSLFVRPNFLTLLRSFNESHTPISAAADARIAHFLADKSMTQATVEKASETAGVLWAWIRAYHAMHKGNHFAQLPAGKPNGTVAKKPAAVKPAPAAASAASVASASSSASSASTASQARPSTARVLSKSSSKPVINISLVSSVNRSRPLTARSNPTLAKELSNSKPALASPAAKPKVNNAKPAVPAATSASTTASAKTSTVPAARPATALARSASTARVPASKPNAVRSPTVVAHNATAKPAASSSPSAAAASASASKAAVPQTARPSTASAATSAPRLAKSASVAKVASGSVTARAKPPVPAASVAKATKPAPLAAASTAASPPAAPSAAQPPAKQ